MPNYDFKCSACDMHFKKSLPYGSKELPACPKCKGKTQKILTPPMTIFKGSGFYKTDSRGPPPAEKAEEKKPDTAPAAKTDTQANSSAAPNATASK